jgi:hypothetical protein
MEPSLAVQIFPKTPVNLLKAAWILERRGEITLKYHSQIYIVYFIFTRNLSLQIQIPRLTQDISPKVGSLYEILKPCKKTEAAKLVLGGVM